VLSFQISRYSNLGRPCCCWYFCQAWYGIQCSKAQGTSYAPFYIYVELRWKQKTFFTLLSIYLDKSWYIPSSFKSILETNTWCFRKGVGNKYCVHNNTCETAFFFFPCTSRSYEFCLKEEYLAQFSQALTVQVRKEHELEPHYTSTLRDQVCFSSLLYILILSFRCHVFSLY
jgi:hypothetical protein